MKKLYLNFFLLINYLECVDVPFILTKLQ